MGDVNITINQGAEQSAPDMLGALPPEQPTDGPPLLGFNPLSEARLGAPAGRNRRQDKGPAE